MEEKKQAILDSALDLINEGGFHGTSMSQLAKHANVAAGTIYHYFESKEAMICALHSHIVDKLLAVLTDSDDKALSFETRFNKLWMSIYKFHVDHPGTLRFYEQFVNSPFYFKNPKRKEIQLFFERFLEEGMENGKIESRSTEVASSLYLGSVITALKMKYYKNMKLSEESLNDIIDMQWKGLKP